MSDAPDPRPVGDSLDRLARRLGVPQASVLSTVFARWEELVGSSVAAHAWPVSLLNGVLVVGVDQPAWATQLRYLGADLLGRLGAELPEDALRSVEVKVLGSRPHRP